MFTAARNVRARIGSAGRVPDAERHASVIAIRSARVFPAMFTRAIVGRADAIAADRRRADPERRPRRRQTTAPRLRAASDVVR